MNMTDVVADPDALSRLADLLRGRRILVLAGAGCSTESGIPDYRGPDGSLRARMPVQYQDFIGSETSRVRYWARSAAGWPRVAAARPNRAHECLVRLEDGGAVTGIITQNVDGLHGKAGSRRVVELHGSLAQVLCLSCGSRTARQAYQERLLSANPHWAERVARRPNGIGLEAAPDGDANLPPPASGAFHIPGCDTCDGIVKPDVVFFGENVPAERVREAWRLFELADALLVVGSSLTVYSGRRFIYRAQKDGLPIAVVNLGRTRADEVAAVKVEGRLGHVLPRLEDALLR